MKKKRLLKSGGSFIYFQQMWLAMKLCAVFSFLFVLNLSANVYSQQNKVSLNLSDVTIEEFIEAVKQQTGVNFFYNSSLFNGAGKVSLNVKKESLDKVLQKTLEKEGFIFDFQNDVVVIRKAKELKIVPPKSSRTIKGVVRDNTGALLPGVSVVIKGTQTGVATDVEGRFEIKVEDDPGIVLQFSFIGMKSKEIKVGTLNDLKVVLENDTKALEEVLVTGYQTISRERATGSFDIVSSEQLAKPASDLSSRLIGTTAGVQNNLDSDGNLVFEIRGQTSLNKDNARPLIVVDGFPVEGEFSSINPNDVESVTILKDAAAASIWGARSANGVIIVTTKKGQKSGKAGLQVEVSAFVKFSPKIDLDYYNPMASSAEVIDYERKGFETNFFGGGSPISDTYSKAQSGYSQAMVALNEHRLGFLFDTELDATLEKLKNQNNKDQIRKYLLQNPLTHQYNIKFSGGSDRMNNLLSLMYESDRDGFKENKKDRLMVNYRTNAKLFKWLDFNFSGMFQYNDIKNSGINASGLRRYTSNYNSPSYGAAYGSIKNLSPYDMLVNPDGSRTALAGDFYTPILKRHVPIDDFTYSNWSYNPITEIENRDLGRKELNARAQVGLTVKFMEGLTFDTKFQYEMYNTNYKDIFNENTYYARKLINTTSSWDQTKGEIKANLPKGGIMDMSKTEIRSYDFRNQLNFVRSFNDRHDINVIAGVEISERVKEETIYARTYGYNKETLSVGVFPNGPTGSKTKNWMGASNDNNAAFKYINNFTYNTDRYYSLYANAAYTFDQKYTVSGSVRTDASNLITDDPKYRYSPFWSVGLGWQIGKESFMKELAWLDRLNVRLTYGYNGNVDKTTSFRPLINVSGSQNIYIHDITAKISSFGNPTLRWEKTGTYDLGIDYSMWGGKLYGKVDVYSKDSKDLITSMTIPAVNGTKSQKLNAATMSNRGIELEIGTRMPIKGQDIMWSGSMNFSYNKNKIRELYKATYSDTELYGGGTGSYVEGHNANTLWVFEYGGIVNKGSETAPNWQPVVKGVGEEVYTFTGFAPGNAREFMKDAGTRVAPYGLGFSNSFKIYDFNLSFIITGKFGHKFRHHSFNYPSVDEGKGLPNDLYAEALNYNPAERVPVPIGKDEPMYFFWDRFYPYLDYQVDNASHVRLQEVNISYNMPARWLNKIGLNALQVYAQGNNLFTITHNKYNEDPEYPKGSVKPMATYTFGLRFGF